MRVEAWMEPLHRRALLAPMAGVTDRTYRLLCHEHSCPYAVTEMVSAKGFLLAGQRRAVKELLELFPGERAAVQIFGHDPQEMAQAAAVLSGGPYTAIDINMGCPAPKITGNGDGSALLRDPALAERVTAAVVGASSLPVTVKMRLGWDESSRCHVEFAKRMAGAGASLLTVHGRTRVQQYAGQADWAAIAQVVEAVDIPVLGNGDVRTPEDFSRMLERTGCYGVMIGRGALGNPWLFSRIEAIHRGEQDREPTMRQRALLLLRHAKLLCEEKTEAVAMREMRKHAAWYMHGLRDAAALRRQTQTVTSYAELADMLKPFLEGE